MVMLILMAMLFGAVAWSDWKRGYRPWQRIRHSHLR